MKVNNSSRRRIFVASGAGGQCPTIDCGLTSSSKMRDDYISSKVRMSKSIAKLVFAK
jgi:hypothetical protein